VWVRLPGAAAPAVAGRIAKHGDRHLFASDRSYRARADAMALSPVERPHDAGTFTPEGMNTLRGGLRDGGPDAWGRTVIGYRHPSLAADELD
jgi:serine/threonine-protein kinase HipA